MFFLSGPGELAVLMVDGEADELTLVITGIGVLALDPIEKRVAIDRIATSIAIIVGSRLERRAGNAGL
jgi:hypothetical protein